MSKEGAGNRFDLTIISVSRDDPDGLARTLRSVEKQSIQPAEVVVVRCGTSVSVDLSGFEIARLIECPDPGRGIAAAFNTGLSAAGASWVMFLNGGDELREASALETLSDTAHSGGESLHIVGGFACSSLGDRVPVARPRTLRDNLYLSHQASIFRRELFASVGEFDVSYYIRMDLDWLARYGDRYGGDGVQFIDVLLVRYELDGVSSRRWLLFYIEELRVLLRYPAHFSRILRLLVRDIPARLASPRAWKRRLNRMVGRRMPAKY